ncbi:MAG: hypothetical protein JWM35_2022 [Verrucomicrobia bacterium]|nr:hypothetical protein [Verrucomicrobiota bacterium]
MLFFSVALMAEDGAAFAGLGMSLGNLPLLSSAKTRSITAENPTGAPGAGAMSVDGAAREAGKELGQGWKISPYVRVAPGQTCTMATIAGPGSLQHIWIVSSGIPRRQILRFYWDDETEPSVESPLGDFFAAGWDVFPRISSLAVCVNPANGLNCYWPMPFRKTARVTLENLGTEPIILYYQIDYALSDVRADAAYFHAQFRRENPVSDQGVYTILDGVKGRGHYVGTYLAWGSNTAGWWGEGEVKFYLDGDADYPTICGTGTEDYFGGANDFQNFETRQYQDYSTPYSGFQAIHADGLHRAQQRFGMFRWHIMDPIRFQQNLKVTVAAMGWDANHHYRKLRDDLASVAFWYQAEPHAKFPKLPSRDELDLH